MSSSSKERLAKVLAARGVASRRQCEELIEAGRVRVNGKLVKDPAFQVEPGQQLELQLDGCAVKPQDRVYLVLHKPPGVITTVRDPQGRPTVMDYLPPLEERVYPVGRLDSDSEGLILLTNDGELTSKLLHPSHQVEKEYLVWTSKQPAGQQLDDLRQGIPLADGMTPPCEIRVPPAGQPLAVILRAGRNRQVRRMFAAIGCQVERLLRTRIGTLTLGSLQPGQTRELTQQEIADLRSAAGEGI